MFAALALTLAFAFLRFPYNRMSSLVESQVEALSGVRLTIGELSPSFSIFGPGIALRDTRAEWGGGQATRVDQLALRPAWSTSWFQGDVSLHIDLESPVGQADGVVRFGEQAGWDGRFGDLDLELVPFEKLMPGLEFTGTFNADADVHRSNLEEGPPLEGSVELDAREGSIALPNLPIALPFDSLQTTVIFGGEVSATVEVFELEGPILSAVGEGTVGLAKRAGSEPLALVIEVDVKDPQVQAQIRRSGVQLDPDGRSSIRLGGTLAKPRAL